MECLLSSISGWWNRVEAMCQLAGLFWVSWEQYEGSCKCVLTKGVCRMESVEGWSLFGVLGEGNTPSYTHICVPDHYTVSSTCCREPARDLLKWPFGHTCIRSGDIVDGMFIVIVIRVVEPS